MTSSRLTVSTVITLLVGVICYIGVSAFQDSALPDGWVPLNQQMSDVLAESGKKETLVPAGSKRTAVENAPAPVKSSTANAEPAKLNINKATASQLNILPGIGDAKAKAIVSYRQEHGLFTEPADIMKVKGIGEKMFEKLKDRISTEP